MPTYRVVTRQQLWMECIHEVVAADVRDAIAVVYEDRGSEPVSYEPAEGSCSADDMRFIAVEEIKEEPNPDLGEGKQRS